MIKTLALSVLVLATSAYADNLEKVCESALGAAPVFSGDYVAQRRVISKLDGTHVASLTSNIKDFIVDKDSIHVLTPTSLLKLDQEGNVTNIFDLEGAGNPAWAALSMIQFNRTLIVSRGAAGIFAFDMDKLEVIWNNSFITGDFGQPSGLATDGNVVYAASATSFENGFTGVVTLNPLNGEIIRKTPLNVYRAGVFDTEVKAKMNGPDLVLNNGGWIHVITKKQLDGTAKIRPRWAAVKIPASGSVHEHFMMLIGGFMVKEGTLLGCGKFTIESDGSFAMKSKVFNVKL